MPAAKGGTNGIANRVPACRRCNSSERRDREFEAFLREKCSSEEQFEEKRDQVKLWSTTSFQTHHQLPQELADLVGREVERLQRELDASVSDIRSESARLGWPKHSARDLQTLAGLVTPKGSRARGNGRRR